MEFLHNLWNIISTEDEILTQHVVIFLAIIEHYVVMNFFTSILDIKSTKKQRVIYIITMEILTIIMNLLVPNEYSVFISLLLTFFIIKLEFKTTFLKSIIAEIITMLIVVIVESIYSALYFILFKKTFLEYQYIISFRVPAMLLIYLTIFLLSFLVKSMKDKIPSIQSFNKSHIKLLIINLMFVILVIGIQFYLFIFYNSVLPIQVTLISLFSLIAYSLVSIFSIIKTINLDVTKNTLEQSELHNKSLELLYNNVSAFKHDFSNIITALGGYIYSKNMDGLKQYYEKIVAECHINNNLSTLNPKIINNPAIYNILATKYYKADELGITINLQIFINLNNLKIDIYDFCRIIGILLDNAIEAASKCDEKIVNIEIHDVKPRKYQILMIENTYEDKNIDIGRLSEKGYTSKTENPESHGIGLWQVSKIIKKHNNLILNTTKDEKFFRQELTIYYK